jgi:DNA polymerase-4
VFHSHSTRRSADQGGSIGSQRALGSRPRTAEELDLILTQIVDRLARRLRDGDRTCRTIVLRLRFGDFARATRSRTLGVPSDRTSVLLTVARSLLAAAQPQLAERGVTLIGVSLSQLGRSDSFQPELPLDWNEGERLDTVLDAVRDRFGAASVARATQLGRDPGWSTPLLPEHE